MNQNLFENAVDESRDAIQKMIATSRKCLRADRVEDARRLADKARGLADESMKCAKSGRDRAHFQVLQEEIDQLSKELRGAKGKADPAKRRRTLVRGLTIAAAIVFIGALYNVLQ